MSDSTYMSAIELKDLTGLTQSAAQIRWLKTNGVVHYIRVDGKPRVPKDKKGHPIRMTAATEISGEVEPDFGALRSLRVS